MHRWKASFREAGRRHNLPAQVSTFVGRASEITAVERLSRTARLTTLTGTGGVGKTRLALQIGHELIDDFAAGVWLVELAGLADPDLVPQAVAAALGIPGQAGRSVTDSVALALARQDLLLIVDNCEHLLDACAGLIHQLLCRCPNLHVLVTSREPLGIAGEHAWPVPSLSLPSTLESITESESVQLFVDRLGSLVPSFTLAADNVAAVAEVCTRLDGIPLALELAAARGNVLSPFEIARRLDDRFSLLVHPNRTAPQRHQTLRAAVAWSYDLLSAREQLLFDRLSVFAGGWTLDAAAAVCMTNDENSCETLDLLNQLVAKSLVVAEPGGGGRTRYRLLEILREYAAHRLAERAEIEALGDRHSAFFLDLAMSVEPGTWGADTARWWQRLEDDIHNLRAALRRMIDRGDTDGAQRLGAALMRFWQTQIYIGEGRAWVAELLELPTQLTHTAPRARLLAGAGHYAGLQGDFVLGRKAGKESVAMACDVGDDITLVIARYYYAQVLWWDGEYLAAGHEAEQAVRLSRSAGHRTLEGLSNYVLGAVDCELGNYARARARHEEALRLCMRTGYERGIAIALQQLGRVSYRLGDLAGARRLMEESNDFFRKSRWPYGIAWNLSMLGWITTDLNQLDDARNSLTESLRLFRDIGARSRMIECLEGFAQLEAAAERHERAVRLAGACAALRIAIGLPHSPREHGALEVRVQVARSALGRASAAAWAAGQTLSLDEAVGYALAAPPIDQRTSQHDPLGLTRRERQVAELVARGRTSRQICAELVVAERTVETHLEHIYTKLNIHSRVQLARWLAGQVVNQT